MSVTPPRPRDPRRDPREVQWDAALTQLADRLRTAHRLIAPLPGPSRQRLHRHLLAITDLAKRDHELAARRLAAFLDELESVPRLA